MLIRLRFLRLALVLGLLAAGSSSKLTAAAQAPGPHDECSTATNTASMRTCEVVRYTKATQELRSVYGKLMDQLDSVARTKLSAVQGAWERFRDSNEEFEADKARGEPMSLVLRVSTAADMTEARTAELKKMLHDSDSRKTQ